MSNLFQAFARQLRGSSFVIWITLLAFFALFIGFVHFAEDTYSSYIGLGRLETAFGLKPANYTVTYFTMSIAPQVGQIIFSYMYLVDRQRNWWAGVLALLFFGVDFMADLQDRSGGLLFPSDGSTMFDHLGALTLSAMLTLGYFTIGSELFITAGAGLILELFNDALEQLTEIYIAMRQALRQTRQRLAQLRETTHDHLSE